MIAARDNQESLFPEPGLPGREVRGPRGTYWQWTQVIPPQPAYRLPARPRPLGRHPGEDVALEVMEHLGWDGVVFVDLETCGFSGTPLFLVGLLGQTQGQLVLTQLLARNYAEEAAVVAATVAALDRGVIISFNGKSYDIPFLSERAGRHGLRAPNLMAHLDLLHTARRRWRYQLPDCRLTTLETAIRGVVRWGDIPGRDIPERYHRSVRTDDPNLLLPILRHNHQDLLTLLGIVSRLDHSTLRQPRSSGAGRQDRRVLGLTRFLP